MSKNGQKGYYLKATQSIFLVAGILMVFTFPYFLKYFNFSGMAIIFTMVLLAVLAGFTGGGNKLILKFNTLVAIVGFVMSAYRGVVIFFRGVEEPLAIFSFWTHQILALVFFIAIYFAVRAMRS
ncbi:MAG: hypothetical protein R3B39_02505 [Candidatus Paceibacterota bacterium]